ncbi:MAG: RidA family protein [Anaerolineales bacterium]|jgi:2-iminobutanoate/2-iminopropanoate deaminase
MSKKEVVISQNAPGAIGPYSVGIKWGDFVFMSGQLGIDPGTGEIVEGGIQAETKQALKNLQAILKDSGMSLDNVVKTTVFLNDINDFLKMNEVYSEFFTADFPARSAVQVAALPKGGLVEIEAIAIAN